MVTTCSTSGDGRNVGDYEELGNLVMDPREHIATTETGMDNKEDTNGTNQIGGTDNF